MRERRPTCAMPKSFLRCERAFFRSMVVMSCVLKWSVLMSSCLLRGQAMWWARHLMRCDGMCCVMSRGAMRCHGDGPLNVAPCSGMECYELCELCGSKWFCDDVVLKWKNFVCTTNYYSSTNLYYVLYTSTTLYYKELLQYYSGTTKYYNVLLQCYPVLQSTSPVLQSISKYHNVLLQYYSVLQRTTPILLCSTKYYSSTTKYDTKYHNVLLE